MSYDKRYYGIYQGFVKDTDDPENNGRVRLTVPQVTGEVEWTGWAPSGAGGSIAQTNYPYGTFYTEADQAISINTATLVTGLTTGDANKMELRSNRIYVEETGDYFVQFSAMFIKTNAASGTADLWFRKNGVNIPDSNTRITLSGSNAEVTMTVGLIIDLEAGEYIEFVSSASANNTFLSHSPAGVGPAVPSLIATLSLIGKYKPKPDQKVWVMYIGGDPNFPVWMGAQA